MSYNTRALLDSCLASVVAEGARGALELDLVVVDNGSTDGSADWVRTHHEYARLLIPETNLGYAGGVNLALSAWAADRMPPHILIANADVELLPGALDAMLAAADRDVAAVGPALEYPGGAFQHSAFKDPGLIQTLLDVFPIARLIESRLNGRYPRSRYGGPPFEVDFPLGACFLVSAAAVADVGVMDEGFFMYCEEIEWCRRFRRAGWRVVCAPSSRVVHHAGASTSQARDDMWVALWRSRIRYFRLAGPRLRAATLRAAALLAMGIRSATGGGGAPPGASAVERWANARRALA